MAIGITKGILRGRKRKGEMLKLGLSQDFGSARSTDSLEKGLWHGWMLCTAVNRRSAPSKLSDGD